MVVSATTPAVAVETATDAGDRGTAPFRPMRRARSEEKVGVLRPRVVLALVPFGTAPDATPLSNSIRNLNQNVRVQ